MNDWQWPRVILLLAAAVLTGLAVGAAIDGDGVMSLFTFLVAVACWSAAEIIHQME